ncbi:MAG: SpoIIE family protein phosphatase [Desulfobacterales bacterium]|nr:SpoIIE family protein phosphatase [Desulfobacterales bacterium]
MDDNSKDKPAQPPVSQSEALEMAQVIIDNSPVVLFRRKAGDDPKLIYVSDNISRFGYKAETLLNGTLMFKDIIHKEDADRVGEEIARYAEKNIDTYNQIYRIVTRSGETRWLEDRTSVIPDENGEPRFNQGVLVDITERKEFELKLAQSEEKYRRIVSTSAQGFILMDEDLAIMDMNDTFCSLVGYHRNELTGHPLSRIASPAFKEYIRLNRTDLLEREVRAIEGQFIKKQGQIVPILVHSSPLTGDTNQLLGTMAFITDMTEHKKALELAGEVQKSLLPRTQPNINGFDIAGKSESCDEIGGDYFDYIMRGKTKEPVNIVVGDITGHGVDAALFMTTARGFLRMRAAQPGDAAQIITDMNRHLSNDVIESGRFMTLFYISLDPSTESFHWVRAGHDPAMIYDPDADRFETLMGKGPALGVDDTLDYREQVYPNFTKGKMIVIGTDGIWESQNPDKEMFGKDRFKQAVKAYAGQDANTMVAAIFKEIKEFRGGQKPTDDLTLVIIKRV